jgi:long-chain fatty acid transport protein
MRRSEASFALALAFVLALPASARAQGYGVYEQGACATGRAGTGAASPCADGSGMYYNPAGIADLPFMASAGTTMLWPHATFVNNETQVRGSFENKQYWVPNFYLVKPITKQYVVGFGLYAPYGLTTDWNPNTFEGRFLGYHTSVRALYLQPTMAARFGKLKIGAGLDITNLDLNLKQKLDLSQQALPPSAGLPPGTTFGTLGIPYGTDFANAEVSGNAWGIGYNLGVTYDITNAISLGVRYLSRQNITISSGTATFTQDPTGLALTAGNPFGLPAGTPIDALLAPQFGAGGALVNQGVSTTLRLPNQLVMGVAVKPTAALKLLFDAQYTWWEVLDEIPLDFAVAPDQALVLDDNSVWTWRFGGEYVVAPKSATVLRAGYAFQKAAAPPQSVIPNLPEGNRNDFSFGIGTRISKMFSIDFSYMLVWQADRLGRTIPLTTGGPITNGLYQDVYVNLFGVTLTANF